MSIQYPETISTYNDDSAWRNLAETLDAGITTEERLRASNSAQGEEGEALHAHSSLSLLGYVDRQNRYQSLLPTDHYPREPTLTRSRKKSRSQRGAKGKPGHQRWDGNPGTLGKRGRMLDARKDGTRGDDRKTLKQCAWTGRKDSHLRAAPCS